MFALAPILAAVAWSQATEKVLYSFQGGSDGAYPVGGLIFDSAGNLYGATGAGGANGDGTVFELTPSNGRWKKIILHNFTGSDGSAPTGGLIFDRAGNLYGTTYVGGANGEGTVFELMPSNGNWIESVLHSFSGSDGSNPAAGLILDSVGNLYGTTQNGGASIFGTVFELMASQGGWSLTTLHSFVGSDGLDPIDSLIFDSAGNLYGTTEGGGPGGGTTFELTPSSGSWTEAILYTFPANVGYVPRANLIFDGVGNLYGTAAQGPGTDCNGRPGCGTVFELSLSAGNWTETTLHNFTGSDGEDPVAGLIFDSTGNLYGTTLLGGANGLGAVFKLDTSNNETVLHSFSGGTDGSGPNAGLVMDSKGNFFGTAYGGAAGYGVVFEITGAIPASPWQPLKKKLCSNGQPCFSASTALLLTDGTVMVQDASNLLPTGNWWRLTPDINGSYVNGAWSSLASMPLGYGPKYYASAVLADGKVIVEGGEYNLRQGKVETPQGAIYDPTTNMWSTITPPTGWVHIGDAASVVLPNGLFMIGNCGNNLGGCSNPESQALTRTSAGWIITGSGKADANNEEGWTLLPSGEVLTIDVWDPPNTELYNPNPIPGSWSSAGSTPVPLIDTVNDEAGPAVLLANGTVFATGATGYNAIYNLVTATWSAGPTFPFNYANLQLAIPDGPAALLPNGNVLCDTSPVIETGGVYPPGSNFFEFNGTSLTLIPVPGPPNARNDPAYVGRMLLLPTGQVLFTDGTNQVEIYTPTGSNYNGAPTITSSPATIAPNQTGYQITGTQFNGLSQGAMYGDDAQMATNYPLVRITNNSSKHVFYVRTHNHSTMGIATGGMPVSTYFDTPTNLETGASTLVVVANGIPSKSVSVTVQ